MTINIFIGFKAGLQVLQLFSCEGKCWPKWRVVPDPDENIFFVFTFLGLTDVFIDHDSS